MVHKDKDLLNSEELMERWQISELDLLKMLVDDKLKHYRVDDLLQEKRITTRVAVKGKSQLIKLEHLPEIAFAVKDVEEYEKENPEFEPKKTIGKALRKLGQLEGEKEKWDLSLKAAVQIGIYIKETDRILTREEIEEKLYSMGIESSTIKRIVKVIPKEYRLKSGHSPKEGKAKIK